MNGVDQLKRYVALKQGIELEELERRLARVRWIEEHKLSFILLLWVATALLTGVGLAVRQWWGLF